MKTKLQFTTLLFLFSIVTTPAIVAQTTSNEKSKSEVLEPATLRVIYTFSQKAEKDREPIVITDTMALAVGQNHSVYYDWNKTKRDSVSSKKMDIPMERLKNVNVMKDEALLQARLEGMQEPTWVTDESKGESAKLFKNRAKNEIITLDKGPSEGISNPVRTYLQVTEIIPPQDWTITEDTMTVLGYACQKATTTFRGRGYTAWFTLDIPLSEGPWKLYGLPGTILKAEDSDGIFQFIAIGISQVSNENIEMPSDRKIVPSTLKQLDDYRKNRFKELMYGFLEGSTLNMYRGRNPVEFNEMEID